MCDQYLFITHCTVLIFSTNRYFIIFSMVHRLPPTSPRGPKNGNENLENMWPRRHYQCLAIQHTSHASKNNSRVLYWVMEAQRIGQLGVTMISTWTTCTARRYFLMTKIPIKTNQTWNKGYKCYTIIPRPRHYISLFGEWSYERQWPSLECPQATENGLCASWRIDSISVCASHKWLTCLRMHQFSSYVSTCFRSELRYWYVLFQYLIAPSWFQLYEPCVLIQFEFQDRGSVHEHEICKRIFMFIKDARLENNEPLENLKLDDFDHRW